MSWSNPMHVFLDANTLIYLFEGNSTIAEHTRQALSNIRQQHPHAILAMSRLSWLECRVKPLKEGNAFLLDGVCTCASHS